MNKVGKVALGLGSVAIASLSIFLAKRYPSKYSPEWIKQLSDRDWEVEREIIRKKFCNPQYRNSERNYFQIILNLFDKVKSEKDWAGVKPQGPAYHREHGFNLYKPE